MPKQFQDQTEFNLRRWEEICPDPELARFNLGIETDCHGHLVVTPPPQNPHSNRQSEIYFRLRGLMPVGRAQVVVPISTSDGIKVCDVTWASPDRYNAIYDRRAHREAPEICVEVLSPADTTAEMNDKKALYFDAGAKEVWFCRDDGAMEFYLSPAGGAMEFCLNPEGYAEHASSLCPGFPNTITA